MQIEDALRIVRPPGAGDDQAELTKQHELLDVLELQKTSERCVLYASAYHTNTFFLHSVLVPKSALNKDWSDLPNWSSNPFDEPSCGLVWGGGSPPRIEHNGPWSNSDQPAALDNAERLVYGRSFDGFQGEKTYYELAQLLTHSHGLHWVEERKAWCRLNDEGDVEDFAGVEQLSGSLSAPSATIVWIKREILDLHMVASETCLAQMFDSVRISSPFSASFSDNEQLHADRTASICYRCSIEADQSYFRGVHFIVSQKSAEELGDELYKKEYGPKEYETFITQDFKNNQVTEVSCSPESISSYFEPNSPKPFETSPVFFKPEVLDKYKADPEKYSIRERSITCRNSWSLQTYDVNEKGQVHTMIVYLSHLPISEQRYWKSFNEPPKGPISKRSFSTDFKGEFDTELDELRNLKSTLAELAKGAPRWFKMSQLDVIDHLNYPLTMANKPWNDTIILLAKCTVESLVRRHFVEIAKSNELEIDPNWGSIKCMKAALASVGTDSDRIDEISQPFDKIQFLRNKLAAHTSGKEAIAIRKDLIKQHKRPGNHIRYIAGKLNESLISLNEIL